jgi:hypothetical protein
MLGTKAMMLNGSHFRNKGISRSLSIGGPVSSPASMLMSCPRNKHVFRRGPDMPISGTGH